ncbi:hypothetical protein [Anaerococcus nagyae]|uniref:hypothetical protein n=1 Tax=Anaerococcus nagyae TaxID=1755241 RepID=UPI001AE338C0|nr:hypothetical protein [Anaerococcus nagyae]MBP2070132.1 PDZ domain-containing secreted protein [Anaerococcus nagyae]
MNKVLKEVTIVAMFTFMFLVPLKNVKADNLDNGSQNSVSYVSAKKFETPIDVLDVNTLEDNLKMTESLDNMDDDQLNEVIDYVANNKNNISYRSTGSSSSVQNQLKVAWKAAAKIARNNGYPLSGTLVEYSVDGMRYYEANGAFSTAIKKTKVYDRIQSGEDSDRFTMNDSKDLYYAIHAFEYSNSKTNKLYITDTFDFSLKTDYKNTFSTLVNNWGYLNQHIDVLKPINVSIEMQK